MLSPASGSAARAERPWLVRAWRAAHTARNRVPAAGGAAAHRQALARVLTPLRLSRCVQHRRRVLPQHRWCCHREGHHPPLAGGCRLVSGSQRWFVAARGPGLPVRSARRGGSAAAPVRTKRGTRCCVSTVRRSESARGDVLLLRMPRRNQMDIVLRGGGIQLPK